MGSLQNLITGEVHYLRSEHLVGRSVRCDLVLEQPRPSIVAVLRWDGQWQLQALRPGIVLLDGEPVPVAEWQALTVGAKLSFDEAQHWRLLEDDAPRCFAYTVDKAGPALSVAGDVDELSLPDPDDAEELEVQVLQTSGQWQVELESGRRGAFDQEVVAAGGRLWRICLPNVVVPTLKNLGPLLHDVEVHICHHDDRRFVGLEVRWADRQHSFGERQRYRLLLMLAEAREQGGDPWLYDDWLCEQLRISSNQMNRWTHDLRRDFKSIGIEDGSSIVERRGNWSRTKEDTRMSRTGALHVYVSIGA